MIYAVFHLDTNELINAFPTQVLAKTLCDSLGKNNYRVIPLSLSEITTLIQESIQEIKKLKTEIKVLSPIADECQSLTHFCVQNKIGTPGNSSVFAVMKEIKKFQQQTHEMKQKLVDLNKRLAKAKAELRAVKSENVSLRGGVSGDLLRLYKDEQDRADKTEVERDELKGAYILLDGLKRRVREAFESWPELAGFKDIAVLLNLKPSHEVVKKHNIEQQKIGAESVIDAAIHLGLINNSRSECCRIRDRAEQLRKELEK